MKDFIHTLLGIMSLLLVPISFILSIKYQNGLIVFVGILAGAIGIMHFLMNGKQTSKK